jgi:cyclophilin family peptidyl-prolyl cis-trans isomerase
MPTMARLKTQTRTLAAAAALALLAGSAMAQLAPDRLYYGVNRSIPMTIEVPSGVSGPVQIRLFAHGAETPTETADAEAGKVDLAGLFPVLWTTTRPSLLYAQLFVGDEAVGAPVVLQPLTSPAYAMGTNQADATINWQEVPGVVYSGLRAYTDRNVVLETTAGDVTFALRPDEAPNTVFNFIQLVEGGFYTDIVFHRIVPLTANGSPFVVQAGDPTGQGNGGPGFYIDLEKSNLLHTFGALSMARSNDPNSNGSQFFIALSREGTAFLDSRYTGFGEAIDGADVIIALERTPVRGQRPIEPPVIKRAYTKPAAPFTEQPAPVNRPANATAPSR